MQKLFKGLTDLIFPPLCHHCRSLISGKRTLLCKPCQEQLTLIDPQGRCLSCFASIEHLGICDVCRLHSPPYKRAAAAFDYLGPAKTLIHELKFSNCPYLAKDLAAFMVVQLLKLEWPMPDILVPVPQPLTRFLLRGYNQSELIAREMGQLLQRPCLNLLKKRSGDFAQTGQSRSQRQDLDASAISWKKHHLIADQIILLIDDVITTGTTLSHCADVLNQGFPSAVYAFAACQA